jgi:hypothetical protein
VTPEQLLPAISACLCAILADSAGGAPGVCCVVAGQPSVPNCECGFAWVRLVSAYPSVAFPTANSKPQNCIIDTWALKVEVGVTRCAPAPCDVLDNSCCVEQEAANAILLDDFRALRQLFTCGCIGIPHHDIVIGDLRVYGPQGGCLGVIMTATIFTSE